MTKYADGPTTEVSIEIAAEVATIWALVVDPTLPPRFSSELQEACWNPEGPPPGLGAEILGRNRMNGNEWTTTSWVTTWEPEQELSYVVADRDAPAAQWWFRLKQASAGGLVTLTQAVRVGPGRSGLTAAIKAAPDDEEAIVAFRLGSLQDNMKKNLDAFKALAEGTKTLAQLSTQQ